MVKFREEFRRALRVDFLKGLEGEMRLVVKFHRELHAHPGMFRGDTAIEFTIDEVGDTSEEETDRSDNGEAISECNPVDFVTPRIVKPKKKDTEDATMASHTTFPDAECRERIITESVPSHVRDLVKEDVAESTTDEDAEDRCPDDEVLELINGDGVEFLLGEIFEKPEADDEAHEVSDSIPTNGDTVRDLEKDGIQMMDVSGEERHCERKGVNVVAK